MMVTCPNCQHKELMGALFCSECGTQLVSKPDNNHTLYGGSETVEDNIPPFHEPSSKIAIGESIVSLHLIEMDQLIPLSGAQEFTLGRISKGQSVHPDVDLSPYHAYLQGVSRMHASIEISQEKVSIRDLDSVNGTRVNGVKLLPNVTQKLIHGDMITLGKLKIQVLIRDH